MDVFLFVLCFGLYIWFTNKKLKQLWGLWLGTGLSAMSIILLSVWQEPDFFETIFDAFLIRSANTSEEARQQIVQKFVNSVYVYEEWVIAITLHGYYGLFLDDAETFTPLEVLEH